MLFISFYVLDTQRKHIFWWYTGYTVIVVFWGTVLYQGAQAGLSRFYFSFAIYKAITKVWSYIGSKDLVKVLV